MTMLKEEKSNLAFIKAFPERVAISNSPKGLIVFLHGYGSDGNDLMALTPLMQKHLPDYHFISPHGIEPFELAARGRQWFSLKSYDAAVLQPLIASSAIKLQEVIAEKQQSLCLTNQNTIIIGFSQGTILGLYLTLVQDEPFAAMIGFSGLLVPPMHCKNVKTPICLIHGEQDTVIPISELYKIIQYIGDYSIKFEAIPIQNLGHSIDMEGIEYAISFIQRLQNNKKNNNIC
jgi:phospholipase/carboxylesterase